MRIIFVDETIFSMSTVFTRGFAAKYKNCSHPTGKDYPKAINVIAGISAKFGLEGLVTSKYPINSTKFLTILNQFDQQGKHYVLFGDNASWHKSKECWADYRER